MPLSAAFAAARAAYRAGDLAAAAEACRRLLEEKAADVAALHLMGVIRFGQGEREESIGWMSQAVALAPAVPALRIDLTAALMVHQRIDEAIEVLRAGLVHCPGEADLSLKLAKFLTGLDRHSEAQAVLATALERAPTRADLLCDLAIQYAADFKLNEAMGLLRIARMRRPKDSSIHLNLGTLEQAFGHLDRAVAHHREAVAHAPDNPQAHINLAMALLCQFNFEEGFAELEWRCRHPGVARPDTTAPRWDGSALDGRRLLVTVEQGFGDIVQYMRFLPPLTGMGGTVILECRPDLARLFAGLPGIELHVTEPGGPLPPADVTVPLMSLPFLFGCDEDGLRRSVPYLPLPAAAPATMQGSGLKVGLVWASSLGRGALFMRRSLDRRSCPLAVMAPLVRTEGASFFGLQKGPPATELAALDLPITDLGPDLADFADTAAAIAGLDLVIAVDTSVAHVAAAMGKPVWILLTRGQADYRWGIGGETSPWYPNARLFRAGDGGWPALVEEVGTALAALIAAPASRPAPPTAA